MGKSEGHAAIMQNIRISESNGFTIDDLERDEDELVGALERSRDAGSGNPLAEREWLPSLALIHETACAPLHRERHDPATAGAEELAASLLERLAGALFPGEGKRNEMRRRAFARCAALYMAYLFALEIHAGGIRPNEAVPSWLRGIRPTDRRAVHHRYVTLDDFLRLAPMAAACHVLNPVCSFKDELAGRGRLHYPREDEDAMLELEGLHVDFAAYWNDFRRQPMAAVAARALAMHAPRTGPWAVLERHMEGVGTGDALSKVLDQDVGLLVGAFGLDASGARALARGSALPGPPLTCEEFLSLVHLMSMRPYADEWLEGHSGHEGEETAPREPREILTADVMQRMCANEAGKMRRTAGRACFLDGLEWRWDGEGMEMAARRDGKKD